MRRASNYQIAAVGVSLISTVIACYALVTSRTVTVRDASQDTRLAVIEQLAARRAEDAAEMRKCQSSIVRDISLIRQDIARIKGLLELQSYHRGSPWMGKVVSLFAVEEPHDGDSDIRQPQPDSAGAEE